MYRLDNGFDVLRPLIVDMKHHLSVHALVEGTMPGWAYVDDPQNPRSAFAYNNEGWYLIGNAQNQPFNSWLRTFLCDQILPDVRLRGEDIPLHFHPGDWQQAAAEILPGLVYKVDYQQYFRFTGPLFVASDDLPAGCTLRPVDAALLAKQEQSPISRRLIAWAEGGFGSVEAFLEVGIGMCLERDEQIVCWCMPDCAAGDWCEIGIHTLESERRKGFAARTVAATVEGCIARGYRHIGWHCWSGNEASARLAQKVGFTKALDHPAFIVRNEVSPP
jgi:hypothetical protein